MEYELKTTKFNYTWEIVITQIAIVLTLGASIGLGVENVLYIINGINVSSERYLLTAIFIMFSYSGLVYTITRFGTLKRKLIEQSKKQQDAFESSMQFTMASNPPTLKVLLPSYKEEYKVIEKSLISTILQEYPSKEIVLLIDDPYYNISQRDQDNLDSSKQLIKKYEDIFNEIYESLEFKYKSFQKETNLTIKKSSLKEAIAVIQEWLNGYKQNFNLFDHTDIVYIEEVIDSRILKLKELFASIDQIESAENLEEIFITLLKNYDVKLSFFCRKKYTNVSQASNKSMNLNTYIDCMGKKFYEEYNGDKYQIIESFNNSWDIKITDSDYILILDVDSIILPGYATFQIAHMEIEREIAVTQCPYMGFPNSKSFLENMANVNTDSKYFLHQGFTYFNSSFWVGANSIIRKKSLYDIKKYEYEGNQKFPQYISDRTVIEDTESSMELAAQGWKLHNNLGTLSYSQSPHDFGSIIIQRWRWSNGGLILLSTLFKIFLNSKLNLKTLTQIFFRLHFLIAIAFNDLAIFLLLLIPFQTWVNPYYATVLSLVPLILNIRDISYLGHKKRSILGLFAFNIFLIPINLSGVLGSIQQMLTGIKSPFIRTPKTQDRTGVAIRYYLLEYTLLIYLAYRSYRSILMNNYGESFFMLLNLISLLFAIIYFVGVRNSLIDTREFLRSSLTNLKTNFKKMRT